MTWNIRRYSFKRNNDKLVFNNASSLHANILDILGRFNHLYHKERIFNGFRFEFGIYLSSENTKKPVLIRKIHFKRQSIEFLLYIFKNIFFV